MTFSPVSISDIRDAYGIDPAEYLHLEPAHMPSRAALRAAGYPGKLPLFYRGQVNDGVLADMYRHAHEFGLHDVLHNRTMRRDVPTPLGRVGMSWSLTPLFTALDTADRYLLLHNLLDAYAILGLDAAAARDVMLGQAGTIIAKTISNSNNVIHLADLTPNELAHALPFMCNLRNVDTSNPGALGTTDWRKIAFWADFEKLFNRNRHSDVYKLHNLYTLHEIMTIMRHMPAFEPSMFTLMVYLRQQVATTLPIAQVEDYLRLPLPLLADFFPTFKH